MILMNLANALLWVVYGAVGKPDPMIWGPNAAGALLAATQVPLARLDASQWPGIQAPQLTLSLLTVQVRSTRLDEGATSATSSHLQARFRPAGAAGGPIPPHNAPAAPGPAGTKRTGVPQRRRTAPL